MFAADLAGMVDSIGQNQGDPLSQPAPPVPTAAAADGQRGQDDTAPAQQPQRPSSDPSRKVEYSARYYSGFLTSDLRQDNNANVSDNLYRNLKLAGKHARTSKRDCGIMLLKLNSGTLFHFILL